MAPKAANSPVYGMRLPMRMVASDDLRTGLPAAANGQAANKPAAIHLIMLILRSHGNVASREGYHQNALGCAGLVPVGSNIRAGYECQKRGTACEITRATAGYRGDRAGTPHQTSSLSPPFRWRISRASSGLAISRPRPSMILRTSSTCSALEAAIRPGAAHSESSRPTRTLPPMAAAIAAIGN